MLYVILYLAVGLGFAEFGRHMAHKEGMMTGTTPAGDAFAYGLFLIGWPYFLGGLIFSRHRGK